MATKDKKQGGVPAQEPGTQADSEPPQDNLQDTEAPDPNLVVLAAPRGLRSVTHGGQLYEVKEDLVAVLPEHVNYLIQFMECRRL